MRILFIVLFAISCGVQDEFEMVNKPAVVVRFPGSLQIDVNGARKKDTNVEHTESDLDITKALADSVHDALRIQNKLFLGCGKFSEDPEILNDYIAAIRVIIDLASLAASDLSIPEWRALAAKALALACPALSIAERRRRSLGHRPCDSDDRLACVACSDGSPRLK